MALKEIDGKPIFNAKHGIKLTITPNDIAKADRLQPVDCVIARACRREFHAKEVRVHLARVYVRMNEGNWQRYLTPRSLRSEIIAFDRGGAFAPGSFILPAPSPAKRTGKRQGGASTKRHSIKRRIKRVRHVVTDVRTGPA